jgi:hypothetical protein
MRLELAAQPPCSQKAKAQTLKTGTLDKKGQVLVAYSLFATSPQSLKVHVFEEKGEAVGRVKRTQITYTILNKTRFLSLRS